MKIKRRNITLIEVMIVMLLIALFTGVVAYNYSGSLEVGKANTTKMAMDKLENTLALILAEHPDCINNIESEWQSLVRASPLVKNADSLIKDGWGQTFEVSVDSRSDDIVIYSKKYEEYQRRHHDKS